MIQRIHRISRNGKGLTYKSSNKPACVRTSLADDGSCDINSSRGPLLLNIAGENKTKIRFVGREHRSC